MKQILKLVFLLVLGQTALAQAPSNYTNINGRYRWIAGMFDSTFHIPKGTTPSLRTGGSTNAGGLFYNTGDSSVYTYTGTQWIKVRGSINPSDTTNKYVTQVYKKNASDSVFYVKGGNHLFAFIDSVGSPGGGGGGKVYYFNGGVNMGTIGGLQMYELGDTANTGAAANFTRSTTGNIANFITDPGKPGLLQIPAGVWSVDAWLSETGGGANHAEIWIEVEKWDGSTITTIATSPIEQITEGATPNLYSWSVSIPTTSLTVTDRIIIQFYISNTNGKTVTLYTQNGYVGEVHTTFTTGIGAINGLTAPAQYLVTGTSGTDFNINSSTATHTFNLPTASATNRGALSTTDWSTFNNKIGGSLVSGYLTKATGSNTIDTSQIYQSSGRIGVSTTSPQTRLMVAETASDGALSILGNASNVGTFKFYANDGSTIQSVVNSSSSAMQIGTFVNSEMNLITNSATRVSILNNGNVGIGSGAGTDSMLTVENGARFKRGVRMSGLPTGVGTKAVRIDANGTLSVADTLANGISGSGTTNYIPKFTSSSAIGNSNLQTDASGNLGLGVTPSAWQTMVGLQVGDVGSIGSKRFSAGNSQSFFGNNVYYDNGGFKYIATDPASMLRFVNNEMQFNIAGSGSANAAISFTQAMTLDASGRLGIGTTSPNALLHLVSATTRQIIESTTNSQNAGLYFTTKNASSTVQQGGMYYIPGTNPYLTLTGDNVNSHLNVTSGGNVGIGTTSPTEGKLVVANSGPSIIYNKETSVGVNSFWSSSDGSVTIFGTASNHPLWFYTNNNVRATITAAGNVGIGTTSPSTLLQVNGTITIGTLSSGSDAILSFANNASGAPRTIYYKASTAALNFTSTGGSDLMTLTNGGNVGIGTTSPTDILHLARSGTSVYNAIHYTNPNSTADFYVGIGGSAALNSSLQNNAYLYNVGNSAIVIATNDTERMRITSGGELLINTTSDAGDYKLQVNGNSYFNGTLYSFKDNGYSYILNRTATTNYNGISHRTNNTSYWFIGMRENTTNDYIAYNENTASDALRIASSDNAATFAGSIKTAAPSGGTAVPWKLGDKISTSVTLDTGNYIPVEVNGVTYYLALVTLN